MGSSTALSPMNNSSLVRFWTTLCVWHVSLLLYTHNNHSATHGCRYIERRERRTTGEISACEVATGRPPSPHCNAPTTAWGGLSQFHLCGTSFFLEI